ncbi:MAG TPA: bifunctional phosphoribosyl-AMP cyclohydrolase/phosphoribosyl-ATP diphosphatase HisIE [Pyrinomonadaceae bacterium]|nr:bifunctional phosphoribosyl-AMP cyclohydrolase/phosphoribosyl-ATP diphosphatase HisIE [Pyrinomonadaceae bacterium]
MKLIWEKYPDRLVPAIVQDADTRRVLMLGFMNDEALRLTLETGHVTFYSRSREKLWTKGEESGNLLEFESIATDCDRDTLLVLARPSGPVCHTGDDTCFAEKNSANNNSLAFLTELGDLIADRRLRPTDPSYTSSLFEKGLSKIAQKVGEEAVETVIAAKDDDLDAFVNESADLLFHLMVLLEAKGVTLTKVVEKLRERHN